MNLITVFSMSGGSSIGLLSPNIAEALLRIALDKFGKKAQNQLKAR